MCHFCFDFGIYADNRMEELMLYELKFLKNYSVGKNIGNHLMSTYLLLVNFIVNNHKFLIDS